MQSKFWQTYAVRVVLLLLLLASARLLLLMLVLRVCLRDAKRRAWIVNIRIEYHNNNCKYETIERHIARRTTTRWPQALATARSRRRSGRSRRTLSRARWRSTTACTISCIATVRTLDQWLYVCVRVRGSIARAESRSRGRVLLDAHTRVTVLCTCTQCSDCNYCDPDRTGERCRSPALCTCYCFHCCC